MANLLHKNSVRQKRFTFTFNGNYYRQSNSDSTSYLGIVQDFVSGVPDLNIDAGVLPLTFGGVADGTERIDNSEDNLDRWVVNCMNHTDDNHVYDAEDMRDSALAALNNTTWFNWAAGEDFTPTQLGTWTAQDEVYATHTTYDLTWIPASENTAVFANDHPAGVNPQHTIYLNVSDTYTPTQFTTDFSPLTAVLDASAKTVTLTASSASNMVDNSFFAVGSKYGTGNDGTQIPQWIGTVKSRTIETNGSATIVLDVDSGLVYLAVRAAEFLAGGVTENNIEQLFTTGRHFVVLINNIYLYMIDQINTTNQGYTWEGNITEEDWAGDVSIGSQTETYNILDITVTAVTDTINNLAEIQNIPDDVLSSTKSAINQIRIRNNNVEKTFFGGTRLFVQVAFSAGETPLARLTKAVAVINNSSDVELTASISGTDNNATLRLVPRNTTITWGTPTYASFSNWTGSVATGTADVTSPITLSLALDPNREGSRTGVRFFNKDYVSRTSDYAGIVELKPGRGATSTIGDGFMLDVGEGADFAGDAKDGTFIVEDNATLKFSGQAKENCWGSKLKGLGIVGAGEAYEDNEACTAIGGFVSGGICYNADDINATTANPMTVIFKNGGALVVDFDTDLDGPVFGQRSFPYGRSGAQRDGSVQWISEYGTTGYYDSKGIPFVYIMPGDKIGERFVFNAESGNTTFVPTNGIDNFTAPSLHFGDKNVQFQFSTAPTNTSADDTRAQSYNSLWKAGGLSLTGEVADTLTAYNPITNYNYFDLTVNGEIYQGDANFLTRPTGSKGVFSLSRLWNPSWTYATEPLTGLIESYYDGEGASEATLSATKEFAEPENIGTVAPNEHPFNDAITISDDYGLADVRINGTGINKYKSRNLTNTTLSAANTVAISATDAYVDLVWNKGNFETTNNTGVRINGFPEDFTDTSSITSLEIVIDGSNVGLFSNSSKSRVLVSETSSLLAFLTDVASVMNNPSTSNTDPDLSLGETTEDFFKFTSNVIDDTLTVTLRLTPDVNNAWESSTFTQGTLDGSASNNDGYASEAYTSAVSASILLEDGQDFVVGNVVLLSDEHFICIQDYTTSSSVLPENDSTNWNRVYGWGDSNSDYDGLALVFTKGTKPDETEVANVKLTAIQHATDWFCYSRRDGFRDRIIANKFSGSLTSYQPVTPMEPFLDPYWQTSVLSAIDAYTTKFLTSLYSLVPIYTLGTTMLEVYLPESETWNQIYRYLEHCENNNRITGAKVGNETRPFNVVNGAFDRVIDRTTQVTVDGAINMPNNNLKITVNGSLIRSTDSNAINGIDVGTTKTIDFHSIGSGSNVIKGDLTAKGFTFTETFNTLSAEDSTFNNTDAQDYTIALSKTVVNSTGAPTFSDLTEEVTVNTDAKTTIDSATADMITNGNGAVEINANSNDGRYGTAIKKQSSISYSSSAVSTNDTGYASGDVTLPNSSTDAFVNSGGDILRAGTTGITTDADLTATGAVTLNVVDGGSVTCGGLFRAHSSVTSTTIQATGNVTIDASATNSSGIGINGNAISILGNTIGCEVNAVTTFSTNDVTSGSDVSAGTSATVDVIDNSKVVSPIVNCDYIQNSANVDATTSIDVDISMTGGTADSTTIDIGVDLTGGTTTASGTLTVPLISGAQTTANAGTLVSTTLTSGFVNFSGNGSTITNINGGIIGGTGNLTTTNQITGGSFGANITLLSVPTNTNSTRHTCGFADTDLEMTNSGIVEFSDGASGVATITKGPSSGTTTVRPGGVSLTIAADDGSNNTDNVVLAELPFTVNITSPAGTYYRVSYGSTITAVQTGTLSLDEASLDRDEVVEIAAVRQGYAMVYQTFTVEDLGEGGVQNVLINTNIAEPYPTGADISGVTANGYVWDSDNKWVIFDFADIPQDFLVMNRIMTQLMASNSATAGTTLDAILEHQDASWYRSAGVASGQFIDPTKVKVKSSTAKESPLVKETFPFYDIIGTTTDVYELTDQDDFLGQNTLRPGLSVEAIGAYLARPLQVISEFDDVVASDFGKDLE